MPRNQAGSFDPRSTPDAMATQYNASTHQPTYASPESSLQMQANLPQQQAANYPGPPTNSFVSPSMWQQVVANSLVDGRKRVWTDYTGGQGQGMDAMAKRQR